MSCVAGRRSLLAAEKQLSQPERGEDCPRIKGFSFPKTPEGPSYCVIWQMISFLGGGCIIRW